MTIQRTEVEIPAENYVTLEYERADGSNVTARVANGQVQVFVPDSLQPVIVQRPMVGIVKELLAAAEQEWEAIA